MKTKEFIPEHTVKEISAKETIFIRQEVLRKGKDISTCFFEGDEEKSTFHLGFFFDAKLIGVASFFNNKNRKFQYRHQFQLRGMAVLPTYQNQQVGKNLLLAGQKRLCLSKPVLLWFNARKTAQKFYLKYGYKITGPEFEIPDIGTHVLMYKHLD